MENIVILRALRKTLERKALSWSQGDAMINMLLVWSLHYSKYLSADRTWEHLDGKTAPEDFSLPTSSTSAIRRSSGRKYQLLSLGLGDEMRFIRKPQGAIGVGGEISASTNTENSSSSSYIIFNKSDHVQVLQRVEHLSFTHLSLLQYLSLHEHLRIGGGGKRRELSPLHRNFHALGSVN